MINWNTTKEDTEIIAKIAKRTNSMALKLGYTYDVLSGSMDITATHLNGCPLKLNALLEADDADFAHDTLGIRHHIDRETGQLQNCFDPRYAQ